VAVGAASPPSAAGGLWRAALGLLDRQTPIAICRRLGLNESRFQHGREVLSGTGATARARGDGGRPSKTEATSDPEGARAFVQLPSLALVRPGQEIEAPGMRAECRVVLESVTGAQLSVEFARVDPAWLSSLCVMLLGAAPTTGTKGMPGTPART
jgi:hypothetical protein